MPLLPTRKRPYSQDDTSSSEGSSKSSSNVKVVVRIRPQNAKEVEGNFREVVQAVDENVLVFDPKENEYSGGRKRPRDIRKRRNKDLNFAFDHVFGPTATNVDIYNETTNNVLTGLLDGYNCSVFAYGATGAGKTFTMLGSKDQPGVMYHTMMDLYSRIDNMKDTKKCDVAVSYLEIYNETIRDLLMKTSALPIREDPGHGVVVQGLSLHKPKTAEELLYMLQFGNQNRTQHPTDANAESSRSHAVLQVFVRQTDRTANISTEVRIAKLCLIDLAGSERATVTKNKGSRLREGANINRSLLALGNVINALAENKNKGFIPYRDSKLTRLLKDSLGGNCQTVMIAAVSPSAMTYEDTYNTLRYADRAKHIKATLKKNVLNVDFHMAKYGKIVEELRKEIFELKGKLRVCEERKAVPTQVLVPADSTAYVEHQHEISKFYTRHLSVRCDQLQQEITLRNLQWKMYRKQRCMSRLSVVDEPGNVETVKVVETLLNGMKQKCSCLTLSSDSSRSKVTDSNKRLSDLEQNIYNSCATQDGQMPEVLSLSLKVHELQTDLSDSKQQLGYVRRVVRCQEKELVHNERLLHLVLKLLKKQHYILKGHNILTSDLGDEYVNIQRKVGGQELCWGDQEDGDIYIRGYNLPTMLDLPLLNIRKEDCTSADKAPVEKKQNDANKKNTLYEFTATQSQSKKSSVSYPYKAVDECSPPKAKRVCLDNKSTVGAVRVDKYGHLQPQRKMNQSMITPTKSRQTPSKSQSFCVSRSVNDNYNRANSKVSHTSVQSRGTASSSKPLNNRKGHIRSASVSSSTDFDDDSSDNASFSKSRFSKLNDTISKKEKFSHLHAKPTTSIETCTGESDGQDEGHNLDGTFTVDPNESDIPVSIIPCVDCNVKQVCNKCAILKEVVSQAVISVDDQKSSVKCVKDSEANKLHSGKDYTGREPGTGVVPAQKYTSCIEETRTGSQYGPENDSGTSTIVDQSSNSVASLTSVSTLVDGPNLSQNLSSTDESVLAVVPASKNDGKKCNTDSVNVINCTSNNSASQIGQTVTLTERKSFSKDDVSQKENKFKRSIKFDSLQNCNTQYVDENDNSCTSTICTPTQDRKPLSQVGSCNTPLSSPRCDSRSSFTSSDSDSSFTKRRSNDDYSLSRLLVNEKQSKENCRILNKHGLPSLVSESIISNSKPPMSMKRSHSRGYLQATKAHSNRAKLAPSKSHVRSKSTSNAPTRAAWQI